MLRVEGLNVSYGEMQVLWDVSLHVDEGEIVAIVGSNAAGKTTLLKSTIGLIKPTSGSVTFLDEEVKDTTQVVRRGMSFVPSERMLFDDFTVKENLMVGGLFLTKPERETMLEKIGRIFPVLDEREGQLADTLSGGERQMLAVGRGLMPKTKLLLLDEPTVGLAPLVVYHLFETLSNLNKEEKITILIVEQNVSYALRFSSRCYVLENGRIVLKGESEKLLNDPLVKKAYLGL